MEEQITSSAANVALNYGAIGVIALGAIIALWKVGKILIGMMQRAMDECGQKLSEQTKVTQELAHSILPIVRETKESVDKLLERKAS